MEKEVRCQATVAGRSGSFCERSFTELVLRLFALLRVTVEEFRMTGLTRVILSPSALSGPQGPAPRRGRISTPVAHWLASLKLTHYQGDDGLCLPSHTPSR